MKKRKSIKIRVLLFVLSAVLLVSAVPICASADRPDPLEHILGEVYIQNVATGMYMDIEYGEFYGYVSDETGANAVQRKYSGSNSQKWIIERVQEPSPYAGEIVIRSAYSGKYLGVSYDDTVFLAQYDTIDDFNIWQINPTGNGTYTFSFSFIPTIPDAYTVAVRSPNSSENALIYQMVEEDMSSDECDEWHIVKKVISVVNYYDDSFSGYLEGDLIDYIDDAVSFANVVYARYLGIGIYMDGDAQSYESVMGEKSIADQCGQNSNVICSCDADKCGASCEGVHHKNIRTMSNQLMNDPRNNNHIYVLWANRSFGYCDVDTTDNNKHTGTYAVGAVWDNRPVINMLSTQAHNKDERIATMAIGLAHEMTHCLNMDDVYDNDIHKGEDDQYVCIMDKQDMSKQYQFYHNILAGEWYELSNSSNIGAGVSIGTAPFCPSCLNIMKQKVNAYIEGDWMINGSGTQGTIWE